MIKKIGMDRLEMLPSKFSFFQCRLRRGHFH